MATKTITETIEIGELFKKLKIDKQGTYKAPSSLKVNTVDGFKKVNGLLKTQLNPEWVVKTKYREAVFTDKHKLEVISSNIQDVGRFWKNVEDLKIGELVNTENGFEEILECYFNGKYSQMYDMEVDELKSFYANGFNSHNTALLGNFALNAFLQNKNVLVYTFETSTKRLLSRYYANLINMTKREIMLNYDLTKERMEEIIEENYGDLIIKEYGANTTNANTMLAHINDLSMYKHWKPDLLISDYLLLQTTNDARMNPENSYKYYKTVSEEVRNIGKFLDIPTISATQINRSGQDDKGGTKAITTSKDISESRGIFDTVDFFATINQPARDREQNKVMLYIDKSRNEAKGAKIRLNIDYEHMRFYE